MTQIETISSEAEFANLAGPWDDLVRSMGRPSPFLLHGWLLEWWRHYGAATDSSERFLSAGVAGLAYASQSSWAGLRRRLRI
jgi:hypothetical protein